MVSISCSTSNVILIKSSFDKSWKITANKKITKYLSGVRVTRSLVLCVCFVDHCLYFFFWPLCCLFFFDLRILITSLVSSNSSSNDTKHFCIVIWTNNTKLDISLWRKGLNCDDQQFYQYKLKVQSPLSSWFGTRTKMWRS